MEDGDRSGDQIPRMVDEEESKAADACDECWQPCSPTRLRVPCAPRPLACKRARPPPAPPPVWPLITTT